MICPICHSETEGNDHNGRGLRCTFCWELLPAPVPEPAPPVEVEPAPVELKRALPVERSKSRTKRSRK